MRFFKLILIAVLTLLTTLTIIYSARVSIINNVAQAQLSSLNIDITCLDISFARNLAISVDKLCLQSSQADIEMVDMTIHWRYSPHFKITDIDVGRVKIKGTDHLFSKVNDLPSTNKNNENFSQLLSTILRPYAEQVTQFKLPITINIDSISYLPFIVLHKVNTPNKKTIKQDEHLYTAKLSTRDNTLSFSLKNTENIPFIKAKLTQVEKGFSVALSSQLNLLKSFVSTHQLPITTALANHLAAIEVSGNIDSLIKYQADVFTLQNNITDISISSAVGIDNSGAFKLSGALNVKSQFNLIPQKSTKAIPRQIKKTLADENNTEVALTFTGKNELILEYSQPQFLKTLEQIELSPTIISILKDNPLKHLTLKFQGNGLVTLNDNKGYLSHLEINARSNERLHKIKLDDITFIQPHSNIALGDSAITDTRVSADNKVAKSSIKSDETPSILAIGRFTIDSQLKLLSMAKFTTAPAVLHLAGSLKQTKQETTVILTENSSITLSNIVVLKQTTALKNSIKQKKAEHTLATKKPQALVSLKTLTTTLEGSVQRLENNTLNINLKVNNRASQVNVPNALKISSFNLFSEIKGSLNDINLNASATADGVNLGNLVITGPVKSPRIEVYAKKLQLTDLLSLNIQLPTKIELIDGRLDYNISGQINALSNIENTPLSVSVAVTSLSGEINGIWLQELNWQEHLSIHAGKITTIPNVKDNLTIELIETVTPVSKLSINTSWTVDKTFTLSANKLKADVLGGSFFVPTINWPFEHGNSVNVQLKSIDLEQVLALDEKQGIVVTGKISGQLPVTFDGDKYMIKEGELHNTSNGLIQVIDNPAVAALKANNSQLKLAFDALQNLHYHQLSSAVSMADDGYMQLDTVIKGRNPDLDNDVNLNLNLSYDLLGLLESLSITQRFEESILKGLQKNKG
ncbi:MULTISPECIES: YdbH domain-containing protein [unclassified Colwellia]|uniref:YdbH domain-containing protein n=1 Tax=unclassified Colwellia TaxID=196834 RepID=UPI0015F54FCC|nr:MULTISPECIES: YdbH domain-containing protein [unclassified Colwellia]MBA6233345.1 YdbH domain-containing protein [Colwellia sp. MB02u-7]MBA6236435.1 YdbH domain-containing protein [Colwellia sp. MB02u-11]MBA6256969.1 YdbH domain-containing protein [Colwellia sp. MB3u-28]MBA6261025.1 YdbH domain-containing protein [Colwellia sp. MB3u-41]MBA6298165.1 YdbH domain-containing protein [Colwellia sp. MB3u-22]